MGIRYDRERIEAIIQKMLDSAHKAGIYQTDECHEKLEKLLGEVRDEAVAYTWTEACSHYDRGMDPRNVTIPFLVDRVKGELNPERDGG